MSANSKVNRRKILQLVFGSLVVDLLAFTLVLPLLPRLVDHYLHKSSVSSSGFLRTILDALANLRHQLASLSGGKMLPSLSSSKADVVLLGGVIGSLYSMAQAMMSPSLGRWADSGRRKVLLASMLGNILAAIVWLFATSFESFLVSRLIAGLSEGNVQLTNLIVADVVPREERGSALAIVGICFSLCFTFGPAIGAYFATHSFALPKFISLDLNVYAFPALLATGLLCLETFILYLYLPETKQKEVSQSKQNTLPQMKHDRLRTLRRLHFWFLLLFSGIEFTLTFFTFDLFSYSNIENGKLLGFVGLSSSLMQGGYVRRALSKPNGPSRLVSFGIASTCTAAALMALLPSIPSTSLLYLATFALSITSATVVTSLNTIASLESDKDPQNRGEHLGQMRSSGQLGRALGPLLLTAVYFLIGPASCYTLLSILTGALCLYSVRALSLRKKAE